MHLVAKRSLSQALKGVVVARRAGQMLRSRKYILKSSEVGTDVRLLRLNSLRRRKDHAARASDCCMSTGGASKRRVCPAPRLSVLCAAKGQFGFVSNLAVE